MTFEGVPRRAPIVAIDGPAGAGKSTVAFKVAGELGYLLLDTGALYRCVGLCALREVAAFEAVAIAAIAERLARPGVVTFTPSFAGQRVLLGDEDVTSSIRTPEVDLMASRVSALPAVRRALLDVQRAFGSAGRLVAEGRDVGTVVFPDAELKFFLTASVPQRAARRLADMRKSDQSATLSQACEQVVERDLRDSQRPVAPLRQAPGSELLDTTALTVDAAVQHIAQRARAVERQLAEQS